MLPINGRLNGADRKEVCEPVLARVQAARLQQTARLCLLPVPRAARLGRIHAAQSWVISHGLVVPRRAGRQSGRTEPLSHGAVRAIRMQRPALG
jgi:hypothetical protein